MVDAKTDSRSLSIFGSSWALFLLGILLLVASVNSATLVVRLVALVLVLMLSVRLWTAVGLWRLDLDLSCDGDRFFPGENFSLRFNVANRKFFPLWIRLELPLPAGFEKTKVSEQTSTGGSGALDIKL